MRAMPSSCGLLLLGDVFIMSYQYKKKATETKDSVAYLGKNVVLRVDEIYKP